MTRSLPHSSSIAIARLADLTPLERQVIGCARRCRTRTDEPASGSFAEFFDLVAGHARRPLCGHAVDCPAVCSDECVLARFVALAAEGAREEAILIASLLVRPDVALYLAGYAERVGLALMREQLRLN